MTTNPAAMPATRNRSRRLVRACRLMRWVSARRSASRAARLASRNSCSSCRQRLDAVVHDIDDVFEPSTAVQRAGVVLELDPARRRLAQMAERDDCFAVILDPGSEPRPLAQQRLVRDLHGRFPRVGTPVEREEACLHPRLDDVVGRAFVKCRDLGAARPPPGRLAVRRDDHQSLEHAPYRIARVVVERAVQRFGTRGDGNIDPPSAS